MESVSWYVGTYIDTWTFQQHTETDETLMSFVLCKASARVEAIDLCPPTQALHTQP